MRNWKFPSDFEEVVTVISIARREILTRITKVRGRERIRTRIRASNLPEICISATMCCSRGTSTSTISIHFKMGNLNGFFLSFFFFFSPLLCPDYTNFPDPVLFSNLSTHTYIYIYISSSFVDWTRKIFIPLPTTTKTRLENKFRKIGRNRRIFVLWTIGWTSTRISQGNGTNRRIKWSTNAKLIKKIDLVRFNNPFPLFFSFFLTFISVRSKNAVTGENDIKQVPWAPRKARKGISSLTWEINETKRGRRRRRRSNLWRRLYWNWRKISRRRTKSNTTI